CLNVDVAGDLHRVATQEAKKLEVSYNEAQRAVTAPEVMVDVTLKLGESVFTVPMDLPATQVFEKLSVMSCLIDEVKALVVAYAAEKHKAKLDENGFVSPPIVRNVGQINHVVPNQFIKHCAKKLEDLTIRIVHAHSDAVKMLQEIRGAADPDAA